MENSTIYDLLRSDGSIVINKKLIHSIGLHEAIVFSELLSRYNYFQTKGQLQKDGSFFNTYEDLQSATSLSEKQQRKASRELEKKKRTRIGLLCKIKRIF